MDGTLRVVALGRRVDGASSQTFAADDDWQAILPPNKWVFLAATFDFDTGEMRAVPERASARRLLHAAG